MQGSNAVLSIPIQKAICCIIGDQLKPYWAINNEGFSPGVNGGGMSSVMEK